MIEALAGAIDENIQSSLENIHTVLPAKLISSNGTTALVKPVIKKSFADGTVSDYPEIAEVPILFQQTNRSGLVMDLLPGDFGILLICERDFSNWLMTGIDSETPTSEKFSLTNSCFMPCLRPSTNVNTNYKPLTTTLYRTDAGFVNLENSLYSLAGLMSDFLELMSNFTSTNAVVGSPVVGSPAWVAQVLALQVQFNALLGGA